MFLRWSMRITKGIAYLFTNLLSFLIGYLLAKEFQRHKDKQQQLMWQYESCPQKVTALCNVIRISCFTRDSETKLEFYFYICVSKDSSFIFTNNCSDHLKPSHEWDKRNPFPNPVEQKDYFQNGRSLSLSSENEPVTSHLLKKDFSQLSTIVRHKVPLPFITSRKDLSGTFLKELYRPPEPHPNSEAPLQKCFNVGETVLSLEYLRLLTNLCKRCVCVCYETVKELCSQHSHFKHNFNHTINTFLKELKNSVGAEVSNEIISKERIIIKECCSNTRVYLEYEIVPEEETNTTLDIFFGNSDDKTSHRNVIKSKLDLKSDLESSKINVMRFMKDYENFPRKQAQSSRIHLKNVSSKEDLEIPYDFANYNISSKKVHSNNSVNSFKQNVLLRNVRNLSNTSPEARISTSETLNLNLISKDLMENEAFKKSKMDLNSRIDSSEHNLNSTDHINAYENSMINEREYFEVSSSTILRSEEKSRKGKLRSDVTETNSQTSEKGEEQPSETEIVEYDIYTDEEKTFTAKKYPLDEPRNTNINNNDKHKDVIKDVFSLQTERNFKNLAADPEELQKTTYLNFIDLNRGVVSTQKANIDVLETGKKFSTAADENYYYTTDNLDRSEHLQTIVSKETLVVPTEENLFITQPDFKDFSKQVSDTAQTDKTEHTDSNFIFFPSMEQTNAQTVQYKSKFPFQTLSETNYEEYGKTLGQEDRIRNDQKFIETTHTQSIELSDLNSEPSTLFEMQKNELETTLKAQINFVDLILNSDSKIDNFDNDQFENRFKSEITFTDIFNPEGTLDLETVSINFDAENDEQSTLVKNLNDKLTTTGNSKFEILDLNFENTKHSTAGEMLKSTSNSVSETRNLNSKVVEEPTTTARVTNTELENSKSTAEVLIDRESVKMEYFTSIETNNDAFRGDKTTINSELSFTNLNSENVEFSALDKAYDHELKNIVSSGTRGDTEIQNKDSSTSVVMDNDVFRSSKAKTNEEESTFNSITEFVKFYSKEAAEPSIQNNIVEDKLDHTFSSAFSSATFFDYLMSQNSDFSTITEINEDELESTINSKISAIVSNSKNDTEKDKIDREEIKTPQNSITSFIDLISENYNYSIVSKVYDSELQTINNSEASSIDLNENKQPPTFEIENNSSKPSQNLESIFLNFQPEKTESTSVVKTQGDKSDGYYTENKMNEDEGKSTLNSVTGLLKLNPKIAENSTVVKINDDELDNVQTSEREFVDLNLDGYSTMISISNDKGKNTVNTKSGNVLPDSENFVTRIDKTNNEELRTHLNLVTDFIDLTSENDNYLTVNKINNEFKTLSDSETPSIDENSDENKQLKTIETNDDNFKTIISLENGLDDLSSENHDPSASLNAVNDDLNITNSPTDLTYFQNSSFTNNWSLIYNNSSLTNNNSSLTNNNSSLTNNNFSLIYNLSLTNNLSFNTDNDQAQSTTDFIKFDSENNIDLIVKTRKGLESTESIALGLTDFKTQNTVKLNSIQTDNNIMKSTLNSVSSLNNFYSERIINSQTVDGNEELKTSLNFVTGLHDFSLENDIETTEGKIRHKELETTLNSDVDFTKLTTSDEHSTPLKTSDDDTSGISEIISDTNSESIHIVTSLKENQFDYKTTVQLGTDFIKYNSKQATVDNELISYNYDVKKETGFTTLDNPTEEAITETFNSSKAPHDSFSEIEKNSANHIRTQDTIKYTSTKTLFSERNEAISEEIIQSLDDEESTKYNNDKFSKEEILIFNKAKTEAITTLNKLTSSPENNSENNKATSTKTDNNTYLEKEETLLSHDKNFNDVITIDEFPTNVQLATKESKDANEISSVRTERDIRINTNDVLDLKEQITEVTKNFPFLVTFFNLDDSKIEHLSETNRVPSTKSDNNIYLEKEESTLSHDKNFNYVSTIDKFPTNVLTDVQSATKESNNANDISSVRTERDIRINTNDVLDLNEQITVVATNIPFLTTFFNSDDSKREHLSETNRVTSRKTDNNIYLEKEESTLSPDKNFNYVSTIDQFPTNVLTDVQSATKESKNANDISSVRTERDIRINPNDGLNLNDQITVVTTNFPFLVTFSYSDDSKIEHMSETNRVTSTKSDNNIYLEKEESTLSHDQNFNYVSTIDEFPTNVLTDVQSATKESKNANDISSVRTERDIRINTNDVLDLNDQIAVVTTYFPFLVTFFNSDDSKIEHLSEANRVTSTKIDNNIYLEKEESTLSHDKNFNYVSTIDEFPTNVLTDVQSATKESTNANDISSVRTERDIRINTNDVLDLNDQVTVVTTNFPFLVTFFNLDDSKIEHLSEANRVTSRKTDNNIYLEKEESTLSHDKNFNYVSTIDQFPTNVLTDVQSATKESKNANDISSVRTERDIRINPNDGLILDDQITVVTTNFPFLVTFSYSDDSKIEHMSETNQVTFTKSDNNIYLGKEESTLSHDQNFNYSCTVDEFPTKVITDVQSATKESKNANDISSVRTERDIRVNTNDVLDLNDKITVVTTNFPFLVTFFSSDDSKIDHDGPKETEMKVSFDDTKTYPDSQGDFEDVTKLQKTLSTEELSSLIADKNVGFSTSNNPRTFSIEIDTDSSRNSKQGLEDFDDINEEATFTVKNYVSPASLSSTNKFTSPSVKNEFFTKKEFIEPPATDIIQPSSELSSSDFQTKEIDTDSSKNSNQGLEDFGGINFNGEAKFTTKNNVFPTFLSSTNQFTSPSVKIESLTKEDLVPESNEFSFIEFQTKEMEEDFYVSNTFKTKGESSFSSTNPLTDESLSSTVIPTPFSYSTLDHPGISIKVTTPELSEITLNDKVSTPNFSVTKNVLIGELSPSMPKGNEDFTKNELSSTITNQITNTVDKIDTDFKTSFSVVNQVSGSNSASTESSKEIFATNKKIDIADGIPTTEILKLNKFTSEGSINNPKTNSINQYDITPHPFTSISTTVSSTMKEAVLNNNNDITENYVPAAIETDSKINSEKEIFSKDIDVTDKIEAKNSVGNTQFYVTIENNIIISPDTTIVSAESEIISHTTKLFLQSSEKYSTAMNRDEDSTISLNLNSPETNDRKEVSSSDNVVITGDSDKTVSVTVTPQFYPKNDDNRQTSSDETTLDVRSEVISFTSKVFTQSSEKYPSVSSPDKEITTTLNFLTQPKSNEEKPYTKDIITQYVSERNLDSFTSFTDKTVNLKSMISPSTEDKMSTILPEKKIQVATENTSPKTDSMLLPKEESTNFFAKDLITELNEKDLITEPNEKDLITELNENDLFPVLETDISTEVEDSVSEEILIRTDRDISFPVDEDIAIPSYKTENPPTRDKDKTSSVEETSQSRAGYDALTDDSEINISEFDGLVTTEEQVITNNEVRIQPTEDFPLKEIDITDKNEETTFLGKELIRTEREILSSSQVSGLESSVPDIEQEKSSVDGASNLSLGGNIGISVNADISTELNFKTSSKNFPVSTDQDANTVQETTEKTSVEVVEIETSTKNLGETSSTDLPKTLPKTSATPSTDLPKTLPKTSATPSTDLPKTLPKTSATPSTDLPKTLPKTSATPSTKEKTDDTIPTTEGKEINTIQNVFLSTTVPKSSTEEKKVSETVTSENQRVSSTAQETTVRSTQISEMSSSTIASTSSSTSLSTSSSTSTSKTLTSTSKTLTSTSKKTEVSSSSRVEMVSPSPNADKTTASASESSTIPFHFTIDANYDEIVGRRKKEFEDSLASQLVVVMRIPSQCLENLKVSKGSIEVNFDLSPNSEYGHMADEKALKAAAEELKRMIDNGQLNLNDLNGNTMVIIPIDPPTKAPLVNQTEHTTIILGVVISVFIITVITVAVAAIIIKRKNNMTQRLSPIEEMRSKMPSYREIPFQEALFMKGPAKNKLMLGKYCYDTGKWMGPGPEPVPYQPPESAVYRPPTDTEIRQTPRPPTSVFDSPERNISDHGHMISMDLRHQRSEPSRSDAVNRLKKRERKIKNRLGT